MAIDHIVLTLRAPEASAASYARAEGMGVRFGAGRRAVAFGRQKINLPPLGQETRTHAGIGPGDRCLVTRRAPEQTLAHLALQGAKVIEGPVTKSGAQGPITSVYFNDPDGNLIEISRFD